LHVFGDYLMIFCYRVKTLSKKYLIIGTWALFFLLFSQSESKAQTFPNGFITARAAFLMDADTGAILYEKNSDLPLPPASTTKVMTAIVALERKSPDTFFRVSRNATRMPRCKIGVYAGEKWRMKDLLFSILLNSANDASVVVAEGTAGSVEDFSLLMNRKAKEAGAYNTHFANPHGLDQKNHYATARDMALIFKYAMSNPMFKNILKIKSILIRGPGHRLITLRSHNRLLDSFEGMIGGKTGYTSKAQRCFVGEAERNGRDLLVCVFGSQDHFRDAARLFEYGFNRKVKEWGRSNFEVQSHKKMLSSKDGQKRGYVLQVASFIDKKRALGFMQSLSQKGYPSFIEDISLKNGVIQHRVKVGLYPNLKIARRTKELIKKHFGIHSLILRQSSIRSVTPQNPSG